MPDRADIVLRVKRAGGQWTTLGTEEAQGIVPEGVTMTADQQGPATASFTLRRDPRFPWGDLAAGNQVQVEVNGTVVWGGRVAKTPGSGRGKDQQISVSCEGWRAHLDDDQVDMGFVKVGSGAFRDHRSFPSANLALHTATARIVNDQRASTMGWANGDVLTANNYVGITFDAGPNRKIVRALVLFDQTGMRSDTSYYLVGNDTEDWTAAGTRTDFPISGTAMTAAPATGAGIGGSIAPGRRYVTWVMYYSGAGGTLSADTLCKITGVYMYTSIAYALPAAPWSSNLTANQVIGAALTSGSTPLLSTDQSQIASTSFVIPEFWPDGYRTPRELIEAINAFHDYLWGVDAQRRLYFRARPTDPSFEVGSYSGGSFDDSSLGDLSAIYNKVIVQYTGPDGVPASEVRTNVNTLLTAQGFTRSMRLPVSATLTPAAAQQIGDVWLTRHANAPMSGSITVAPGDIRDMTGQPVHPSVLLTRTGERIRVAGLVDPVTGIVGRVGTIVNVTYNADTETAAVSLDNDTNSFETFLSRLALIQGAGR